ncbi:MAG: hypothetical protein SGPRY_010429, partial [Prymnesium sp.]
MNSEQLGIRSSRRAVYSKLATATKHTLSLSPRTDSLRPREGFGRRVSGREGRLRLAVVRHTSPTSSVSLSSHSSPASPASDTVGAEAGEEAFVRSVLEPIASRLAALFAFQTYHQHLSDSRVLDVPSNTSNAVEHLLSLLLSAMRRSYRPYPPLALLVAVDQLYATSLSSFSSWCHQLELPSPPPSPECKLHRLVLWYLVWGEAANLRLMPELLCFVFYAIDNALEPPSAVQQAGGGREGGKEGRGEGGNGWGGEGGKEGESVELPVSLRQSRPDLESTNESGFPSVIQ